jgi:hypothetical protein
VIFALIAAAVVPLYGYELLSAGGIVISINVAGAALFAAAFALPVPVAVMLSLATAYMRRRRTNYTVPSSPNAVIASAAILLFWIGALGWQYHKDSVFQRNLEARIQPWAESILSRPRGEVVDKGTKTVRKDLVPPFIGHHARRGVEVQDAVTSRFGASETTIVVYYGGGLISTHGYVIGRSTLKVDPWPRKVKDGLYSFQLAY